jgi:AcrR family transcriptional regulator
MTRLATLEAERLRIVEGFIEVVAKCGYKSVSLEAVVARAGVDEEVFRRHFADLEECFLAAWELISDSYMPNALVAYGGEDTWLEQMRAVGQAITGYLMEHPDHARILYVEGLMAGERVRAVLDRNVNVFIELIDLGRQELDDPDSLTRATAEGLAGAIYEQVSIRLIRGADEEIPELLPQLLFMVVRPYLGLEAAMRELRGGEG